MRPQENKGILYPYTTNLNPDLNIKRSDLQRPVIMEIPHKAWNLCKDELTEIFESLKQFSPSKIFILAPLHKGKVGFDDSFCVYSYSDCFVNDPIVVKDDEVCSEEFSYEIVLPFLDSYFPGTESTAFFAVNPENCSENKRLKDFCSKLLNDYPNSIILVSNNTKDGKNCACMWKEALV